MWTQQPPGYEEGNTGMACHLRKALYGLKQAGRAWHLRLKSELESMGFAQSEADPGLFIKKTGGLAAILTYVDDILTATRGTAAASAIKQRLMSAFDARDLGEATFFLGMSITRDRESRTIKLAQERLIIAVQGIGAMERALAETLAYVKQRQAFGKPVWDFQNTRFKLAEVQATVLATRAFVDACIVAHLKGELDAARAALAKAWVSERQCQVMDECLQLFGGYGYMMEYPIAELYVDARVQRIYGGTNEIMKELAARSM